MVADMVRVVVSLQLRSPAGAAASPAELNQISSRGGSQAR